MLLSICKAEQEEVTGHENVVAKFSWPHVNPEDNF